MAGKDKSKPSRILIVEDDSDILEVLKLMLEHEGHAVVTTRNGREALAMAAAKPVDLLLTDISMPDMSGIEIAQALRADDATADVYIAIHTGLDEAWVRERFADYDLFLTKASDTELLVAEIGKLLAQPRLSREERAAAPTDPVFSGEEAIQAQRALRSAMGLGREAMGLAAFVAALHDDIHQLRNLGRSDDAIAELIGSAIGRPFAAASLDADAAVDAGEAAAAKS